MGFWAIHVTKPYEFIGFVAIDVTKPCKFMWFATIGLQPRRRVAHCVLVVCRRGRVAREDTMKNPAPGFWTIFGPLGPPAGPGSLGNRPGSKNSAGCTKNQPRRPILKPHVAFAHCVLVVCRRGRVATSAHDLKRDRSRTQ